jgi:hypothetical protein
METHYGNRRANAGICTYLFRCGVYEPDVDVLYLPDTWEAKITILEKTKDLPFLKAKRSSYKSVQLARADR